MKLFTLSAFLICTSTAAIAHGKATGIVLERMDQMVAVKDAMKALKRELSKGLPYDFSTALEAANILVENSGEAMITKFPEGSLSKHSEALPAIWEDKERFDTLALEMRDHAMRLRWEIRGDNGSLRAVKDTSPKDTDNPLELVSAADFKTFGLIAETCNDCHKSFRKD